MGTLIRGARARTDWLAGIWPIFQSVVSRGDTYAFDPAITERDARVQWMMPEPAKVFVAVDEESGAICGTSLIKPNQPRLGAHVANAAFMVAPESRGKGIGRALGEHAINWARDAGFAAMQFNFVVSTNAPALALWHKLGFSIVGTIPEAFQHEGLRRRVDAFVMHRHL